MTDKKLLNSVSRLGLPMFQPEEDLDVNETLAKVVKGRDSRLREGFPVLLANAAQNPFFSLRKVRDKLPSDGQRNQLRDLVLLSLALYETYHLTFDWTGHLKRSLTKEEKNQVASLRDMLVHNRFLNLGSESLDVNRVKNLFDLYFEQSAEKSRRRKERHEEYSFEYALSQVFSPKQKELFKKKLEGLPLTKTEQEYYSRKVKKKVQALANSELHGMARRLLVQ